MDPENQLRISSSLYASEPVSFSFERQRADRIVILQVSNTLYDGTIVKSYY